MRRGKMWPGLRWFALSFRIASRPTRPGRSNSRQSRPKPGKSRLPKFRESRVSCYFLGWACPSRLPTRVGSIEAIAVLRWKRIIIGDINKNRIRNLSTPQNAPPPPNQPTIPNFIIHKQKYTITINRSSQHHHHHHSKDSPPNYPSYSSPQHPPPQQQ